jgi:SpoVK/Ycf46/Vps4 family AAA+-type ATPase
MDLVQALDIEEKKNNAMQKLKFNSCCRKHKAKEIKKYTDEMFPYYFPDYYEKSFSVYLDLDRCDDGFSTRPRRRKRRLPKLQVDIDVNIEKLEDLVKLAENYPASENIEYSVELHGLYNIKYYLKDLLSFVGLEELKENLLDQIIYFMHHPPDDYLHTVLYGPPGTGKTEIAKILGKIYTKLGILRKGTFVKVTRADLVAGYLGQTAIKTKNLIEENRGGVIFIDEAYALGNQEKRDSFSKEALDTLCELLSDYKNDIMVIIAGYKKELESCFFSYNPGLASRFAWQFEIKDYTPEQLSLIFKKKVYDAGWVLDSDVGNEEWFKKNSEFFKNFGRDVENLFSKCKICHYRRVFGKKLGVRKLTQEDLEKGLEKAKKFNGNDNKKELPPSFMYS